MALTKKIIIFILIIALISSSGCKKFVKREIQEKVSVTFEVPPMKNIKTPDDFIEFTGSELCVKGGVCKLKTESYILLVQSQKKAEESNEELEVYSSYRSPEEQMALWNKFADKYPDETERILYVCDPGKGEKICPHLTGYVVDIRFKGQDEDTMTDEDNKLLEKIMTETGWVRYEPETWHFECCPL